MSVGGRNAKSFEAALFLSPSSMRYFSFHWLHVKVTKFRTTGQEMSLDRSNTEHPLKSRLTVPTALLLLQHLPTSLAIGSSSFLTTIP